jgi:outer membrane lipoprotein SlyB
MQHTRRLIVATIAAVALAGCAAEGNTVSPTPTPSRPPFQTAPPLSPSGSPLAPSTGQLSAITADLAGRGVTEAFTVVKAVSITWRDGSLGCPEPGKMYTQALVPGAQIVVAVGATEYDYRFGRGDAPLLCQRAK